MNYHDAEHYPPHSHAQHTLVTAVRLAQKYAGKIPTVQQLRSDFSMSRATAYRWRAAFVLAADFRTDTAA